MLIQASVSQSPKSMASAAFRSPRRITITVPYGAYQKLVDRSGQEGRSLSNLAAFLLESAMGESLTQS